MTNYDDILNTLDRQVRRNECATSTSLSTERQFREDARLLREAMEIVRKYEKI